MRYVKKLILFSFIGVFCLMTMNRVGAVNYVGFGGSVDSTYMIVSSPYKKADSYNTAGVKWNYTDRLSHTMWFKVVDEAGERMGSTLIEYEKSKWFSTSGTKKGKYYYLHAGRENWWDPWTYVSGTWAP